jgi:hypothetical protein
VGGRALRWGIWLVTGGASHVALSAAGRQAERIIRLAARFQAVRDLGDQLLVLHGRGLVLLDAQGAVAWSNDDLAKDGVEVRAVVGDAILGRGDWDPPGGWTSFAVSVATGAKIEWTGP